MRKETVPIDMASEQRSILGFISVRQLIYLISGGAVLYAIIPPLFKLFPNFIVGGIVSIIIAIPIIVFVLVFGFFKKAKLHLNFDHYYIIKLGLKKQKGIWRKGSNPKKWMVNK